MWGWTREETWVAKGQGWQEQEERDVKCVEGQVDQQGGERGARKHYNMSKMRRYL
jgi:hypothetical protein